MLPDERTCDICRALASQDKVYPLNDAIEVMDNLMALDTKSNSLDDARDYIKALAFEHCHPSPVVHFSGYRGSRGLTQIKNAD